MMAKASGVLERQHAQMGEAGSAEAVFISDAFFRELDKSSRQFSASNIPGQSQLSRSVVEVPDAVVRPCEGSHGVRIGHVV